jgi:tRNA(Arg) A34 adenosine deaminase TadA
MKKEILIEYEEKENKLGDLKDAEIKLLHRVIEICKEARARGNHPFGCLLADPAGNILMEQGNEEASLGGDCTAHAEALLMRKASQKYSKGEMEAFTMFSCYEPCAMCAGAIYWGNLGRLVYIGRESELKKLTGDDPRNPTLNLPSRAVFARGQKHIEVIGPIIELEPELMKCHEGHWHPSK